MGKRVLLAWELGDNFGHVAKLIKIGTALRERGFDPVLSLQNLAGVAPLIEHVDMKLLQSPHARVKPPQDSTRPVLTYADDLRPCGYDRPLELAALLRAWDGMLDLVKPDILIANSAPTALLAARRYPGIMRVSVGLGYEVPDLATPMPALRYWETPDMKVLADHEQSILGNINQALTSLGHGTLSGLRDMLETDMSFIMTWPELDHYPSRKTGEYVGPFYVEDTGVDADWLPRQEGRARIFAYLSHGHDIGPIIRALQSMKGQDVILVARRLSADNLKTLAGFPHLRVYTDPVKISPLTSGADLCITHGGSGTFVQFMMGGVPQLIYPNHIEQLMAARRMEMLGCGLVGQTQGKPENAIQAIQRILTTPSYRTKALEWAATRQGHNVNGQAVIIADRIAAAVAQK